MLQTLLSHLKIRHGLINEITGKKMDFLQKFHVHWLLTVLLLIIFANLSQVSAFPQGKNLPYMTSDVEEIKGKSFDYIIVGGGTTGCSLAATLSEKFSVLIIERGDSPYGNPLVSEKLFYGFSLLHTDELSSVAQSFVSKDGVQGHRGRVLGGSSAINGGFYSRASDDFVKRVEWDEEVVKEAYEWVESKIVFKPALTMWQTVVQFGFLEAGFLPYNGFTWEHVSGTKIGGTTFDQYGIRHTSADLLQTGNPENITVLLNATVKNVILQSNEIKNETIATGINFIQSDGRTNQTYEVYLTTQHCNSSRTGDIILSAGALGSPQILLLSGIGPKKHLNNFNISLMLDLRGVGKNMKDNPGISILVDTKPEHRFPDSPQVAGITQDFKFIIEGGIVPTSLNATRMPIAIKLAFPESKGKLELNNTDPRQNPEVEFNYLEKEQDMEECVKMVQILYRVARTQSVTMFLGTKPPNNLMASVDQMRDFCKKNVRTYYHFHGGCVVGSVVDKDYKVYGVKGLRVIDGSTFVESPGTNPMATLLMLGRYQGIKILGDRKNDSAVHS